ncbi:MAG: DUF3109 family protein [bacterium]
MTSRKSTRRPRFRLNPTARRWLVSPHADLEFLKIGREEQPQKQQGAAIEAEDELSEEDAEWQNWLIGRMANGALINVHGIYVDQAVLTQRFRCVSEQCAPQPGRGRMRSCCADVDAQLSEAEVRRLNRQTRRLGPWLARREPRLRGLISQQGRWPFWLARDGAHLSRLGGRCVFSAIDHKGRIRCRLRAYAKERGIEQSGVQPLPCRVFPLVVLDLEDGEVALTTIYRLTSRILNTFPMSRFPCLGSESHPPIYIAMGRDLDWLFGKGFSRTLARLAEIL